MIHARFIITTNGLLAMVSINQPDAKSYLTTPFLRFVQQKKYKRKEFGECPRTYCNGQAVLPVRTPYLALFSTGISISYLDFN